MGTPEFASASLVKLVKNQCQVVGVVTAPDRPAGRGQTIRMSPVKETALNFQIPVLQPEKLKDPGFLDELYQLQPDLIIVVAFRMLPAAVWQMPAMGTFNLHASLLPQYRGAAPINHALINGEKESGITTFLLDEEIDTGRILLQEKVTLTDKMSAGELHDLLMAKGADLVLNTVEQLAKGTIKPQAQQVSAPESLKLAPKIYKADCKINWQASAQIVNNLVRGLSPYPAAWTLWTETDGGEFSVKVFSVEKQEGLILKSGEIRISGQDIFIGTGTEALKILELQPEGKKRMTTLEFLRGYRKEPDCAR